MALALHNATGLPLGVWRGFFPDEIGGCLDDKINECVLEGYEDCHAVAVLSFHPPRWIDASGIHVGEPENARFSREITRLELMPASIEEMKELFTTEGVRDIDINKAEAFIRKNKALGSVIMNFKRIG
jgi:hypothetical protein